jgi:hypothetical protein
VVGVPDGATPENEANSETAQDAPPPAGEETEPPPPEEQIDNEIITAGMTESAREWLGGIFGFDTEYQHESGGGGAGGQFMFANVDELDGIIAKWTTQRDEIEADLKRIGDAFNEINAPAGDPMSEGQANTARSSLVSMGEHCSQMLEYAKGYIKKLEEARVEMSTMDEDAATALRTTYDA